ncbi:exo-alpha-sialidase [Olivibacter domesticus]|uniref:BNR repeat-like domain-containing protein n=1 Tax=Olivibacter domesticus TaxID=407022 RepID=A0A1H7U0W4_OLID1|nr:exo-alpha-sialidase [Olivibacter domesticus]SEL90338.1 BNR repeat-like domain-containing protein [Olivibacter domesticus]
MSFKLKTTIVFSSISFICWITAAAQDTVKYTGNTLSNVDYHHGQLSPAVGVHNIQVFRTNREHPELAGGHNWTYNHQPMLAYWNNQFFLEFLSDPVGEHIPPSESLLQTSKDGYQWSDPVVVFPPYKIPDGWKKKGNDKVAKDLYAIMHQRMGFYVSKSNRLFVLGYYGVAMDAKDDPNDGNGIGRVIREVYKDGNFGPIHFIRNNASWDKKLSAFPFYTSNKDKGFVEACNELLAQPLMVQQWVEEADRDDPLIPLKRAIKAFNFYHLPNGNVVGLWKHALTSISTDDGKTWAYDPLRAPGFVNSNAKIWGQRTKDGRYATVYNPSEFRWPLAISTSDDGIHYKNLLLVNGEISSMRYGGNYKSYGPQYVRGIVEGNGTPPGESMWVSYSMNKEDMWVARIPIPVKDHVDQPVHEVFSQLPNGEELTYWNLYSPLWASVKIEKAPNGHKALTLHDKDPFDYAKAERVVPTSKKLAVKFTVLPQQTDHGVLHVEFLDPKGQAAVRLILDKDSLLKTKAGYRDSKLDSYESGKPIKIELNLDVSTRSYTVTLNGKQTGTKIFFAPVASINRVAFRTGQVRRFPDADTPTDQDFDLKNAGEQEKEAIYYITEFSAEPG